MNKKTKTAIIIILLAIIIFSTYQVYNYLKEENINKKLNDNIINKAITIANDIDEENNTKVLPITVDFNELRKENKDIVGWIYSEDTPINYPVVKGKDNEKYVKTLINGKTGSAGTLFMDYRNDGYLKDKNSIIYGHNMKNLSMFGTLQKYRNQSYYENHKVMYYFTPEKNYKLELFSGYTTTVYSDIYDLKTLDKNQVNTLKRQSDFRSEVEVNEEDKFITLSTCAYDYDNARYILIGVLREIE